MARKFVLVLTLVLVVASGASAAVPGLPDRDSLTLAVERDAAMFRVERSPLAWQDKLTASMWRRVGGGETHKVLILLAEPSVLEPPVEPGHGGPSMREQAVAAVAQAFVARASQYGLRAIKGLSHLPIVIAEVPEAALADIAADPAVRAIEPDFRLYAQRTEGGALINSPALRSQGGDGTGIVVAVFDTGIDATHTELPAGSAVILQGDYSNTTGDGTIDDNGHGTACAGIIGGRAGGMAPAAKFWAMKVLNSEGSGDFSWTVEAINDIVAAAGTPEYGPVHIVSMSLGATTDTAFSGSCDSLMPTMTAAMQALAAKNIAIFVSSGNDGCTDRVGFPSCISHAISVGATYDGNLVGRSYGSGVCIAGGCSDFTPLTDQITCYSNSSERLDILAPSHDARTPKPGGGYYEGNDPFGGTSAACPYAAGVAAQLLSKLGTSVTPAQLRLGLASTGKAITDPRNGITRRRIDATAAYQYLQSNGGGGGGGGSDAYWIPVAANIGGSGGSYFYSDVTVQNAGSSAASLEFRYYGPGGVTVAASSTPIPVGGQAIYRDIVGQLQRAGSKGVLEVRGTQTLRVASRTYNKLAAGNSLGLAAGTTFGQFIDSYLVSDGLAGGQSGYLIGLTQNTAYRTNVAVANFGSGTASVTVTLYNGSGAQLTSYTVSLAPGELKQEDQPFLNKAGQSSLENGWAKVTVTAGGGVAAYASVLDNVASGGQKPSDPTTVPMKR